MKQVFLLDRQDLADLRSGKEFTINLGNSVVILQAEHPTLTRAQDTQHQSPQRAWADKGSVTAAVADLLAKEPLGLSVTQIAEAVGAHHSTVYHCLKAGKNAPLFQHSLEGSKQIWRLRKAQDTQPRSHKKMNIEDRVYRLIYSNQGLRFRDIGVKANLSDVRTRKALDRLKSKELIISVGHSRGARWFSKQAQERKGE